MTELQADPRAIQGQTYTVKAKSRIRRKVEPVGRYYSTDESPYAIVMDARVLGLRIGRYLSVESVEGLEPEATAKLLTSKAGHGLEKGHSLRPVLEVAAGPVPQEWWDAFSATVYGTTRRVDAFGNLVSDGVRPVLKSGIFHSQIPLWYTGDIEDAWEKADNVVVMLDQANLGKIVA